MPLSTCSAFTTSMITPPFNMRARPVFTVKLDAMSEILALAKPLVVGSSVAILLLWSLIICFVYYLDRK